jgi:hypothetical protein
MNELFDKGFWNAEKRAWLYKVAVAGVPLLVAIGTVTGDMAQLILNVIAAVLGVGAGGMALSNLTPDNVIKVGLEIENPKE